MGKKHPEKGFEIKRDYFIKNHILQYTFYFLILPIAVLVYFAYLNYSYNAVLFLVGFVLLLYVNVVLSEFLAEKLHEN